MVLQCSQEFPNEEGAKELLFNMFEDLAAAVIAGGSRVLVTVADGASTSAPTSARMWAESGNSGPPIDERGFFSELHGVPECSFTPPGRGDVIVPMRGYTKLGDTVLGSPDQVIGVTIVSRFNAAQGMKDLLAFTLDDLTAYVNWSRRQFINRRGFSMTHSGDVSGARDGLMTHVLTVTPQPGQPQETLGFAFNTYQNAGALHTWTERAGLMIRVVLANGTIEYHFIVEPEYAPPSTGEWVNGTRSSAILCVGVRGEEVWANLSTTQSPHSTQLSTPPPDLARRMAAGL